MKLCLSLRIYFTPYNPAFSSNDKQAFLSKRTRVEQTLGIFLCATPPMGPRPETDLVIFIFPENSCVRCKFCILAADEVVEFFPLQSNVAALP